MHIEELRNYCIAKKGVTEEFPFDEDTLAFKVMGKIFALMSISAQPLKVNLKMDAELTHEYRERYPDIAPGYHMNKTHWNTVTFEAGSIPHKTLLWLIDHSYEQVIKGMPRKVRDALNEL